MSFTADVQMTPNLAAALRRGLGALPAADRAHITKKASTKLEGSVNVDAALQAAQPNAARWDYVVGERQGQQECLHWIEVHPASSTGNIDEIKAKLSWLGSWMAGTPLAKYKRQIVWIASGKTTFNQRHPAIRALAQRGLQFAGSHLKL